MGIENLLARDLEEGDILRILIRYEGHELSELMDKSLEGIFGESDDVDLGAAVEGTGDKEKEEKKKNLTGSGKGRTCIEGRNANWLSCHEECSERETMEQKERENGNDTDRGKRKYLDESEGKGGRRWEKVCGKAGEIDKGCRPVVWYRIRY